MQLHDVTYKGPAVDDPALLTHLPKSLDALLASINGWIQFGGAFHVRGATLLPDWHSLRTAWKGDAAFHLLYPDVDPAWIPFAEDCLGDQFFMSPKGILRLDAETGEIFEEAPSLQEFLEEVNEDPVATLALEHFLAWQAEGGALEPGQLLQAFPPFWTAESANGVTLQAVAATKVHLLHAKLARQIKAGTTGIRYAEEPPK